MTTTQTDECTSCRCDIPDGDGYQGVDTETIFCSDCAATCENCMDVVDVQDTHAVLAGQSWCEGCCSEYLTQCDQCDSEVVREDSYYCEDGCDGDFCESCYNEHAGEHRRGPIHDYGYKPEPQFMGKGPRYFGVELEIDGAGQDRDNAEKILEHSKDEALFYIKSDSSLDDGLEIVTHPASLDYHLTRFPWGDISKAARDLGYKSHDAGTCGLHVHVSRAALGSSYASRELTISKLIVLLWRHWHKLYKFSRRSSDTWCHQQYSFEKLSQAGLEDAKNKGHSVALNVSNRDTIEFRIFRGSLNVRTLKAALRMVDVLINIAMSHGILWIAQSRWEDILDACKSDRNLWQYLEVRKLT